MDTELKQMGKAAKAHVLLSKLEDFVKAIIHKEDAIGLITYDFVAKLNREYNKVYDELYEFLVKFIDLHMEK